MASEAIWARRVSEWRPSGQSAPAFIAGRGFSESSLRAWAARLRAPKAPTGTEPVRLARLVRSESPTLGSDEVRIEIGRARVTVRSGVERATLQTVLDLLVEQDRTAKR